MTRTLEGYEDALGISTYLTNYKIIVIDCLGIGYKSMMKVVVSHLDMVIYLL